MLEIQLSMSPCLRLYHPDKCTCCHSEIEMADLNFLSHRSLDSLALTKKFTLCHSEIEVADHTSYLTMFRHSGPDNCTCCYTEMEVADQTLYHTISWTL